MGKRTKSEVQEEVKIHTEKMKKTKKTKRNDDTEKQDKKSTKVSNEIDDLFASKKKVAPVEEVPVPKPVKIAPPKVDDDDDFGDSRGLKKRKRPTTEEGYPIYTDKEMKIGLGGDTPDCPFDCWCCY